MDRSQQILIAVVTEPRFDLLGGCLSSILEATASTTGRKYSVLVVENSEQWQRTADFVAEYSNEITVIGCYRRGIPFARNAALEFAEDEGFGGVFFVDDDQEIASKTLDLLRLAVEESDWLDFFKANVIRDRGRRDLVRDGDIPATGTGGLFIPRAFFAGDRCERFLETWPSDGGTDTELTLRASTSGFRIRMLAQCEINERTHSGREGMLKSIWRSARRHQTWALVSHLHLGKQLSRRRRLKLFGRAVQLLPSVVTTGSSSSSAKLVANFCTAVGLAINEYSSPYVSRIFGKESPFSDRNA